MLWQTPMKRPSPPFFACVVFLMLLLAGCRTATAEQTGQGPIPRKDVEVLLEDQRQAWNRGDWDGFIAGYWDDAGLTFNGAGGITRGRSNLLANYRKNYPDAAARGRLTFHLLEFRPVGHDAALVLGRYEFCEI